MGKVGLKTGGRQRGTPNKTTSDLRSWVNQLLNDNRATIEKDLKQLEPHQRLLILEKLLSYCLPKQQSVEGKIEFEKLSESQLDTMINKMVETITD
jgi:hypothetical protein